MQANIGRPGAGRTGVLPHLVRLVARIATTRGVMGLWREARSIGTHIVRYPTGLTNPPVRPYIPHRTVPDPNATIETPVVLLHGYFHNRSGFVLMTRGLHERGFRWVHGMNYNPLGHSVPEIAESFGRTVEDIRKVSGAERVHVVGHSLGGVVVRWFVEQMGGERVVDTCVTIGTPHQGTVAAYIGPGQAAKDMRPGSEIVRALEASLRKSGTKHVNLYSDFDLLIVPPSSALLPDYPIVHNHLIEDIGHTSLLLSPVLVGQVCDHLMRAGSNVTELRRRRGA